MQSIDHMLHIVVSLVLVVLLVLGVIVSIGVILLIVKLLRAQSSLGIKHGLMQLHSKTKFEKHEAISSRLVKERRKLLKLNNGQDNQLSIVEAAKVIDGGSKRPVVAVRFDGDMFATERKSFAQLVDEILVNRERVESAVVVVSSPGGSVSNYGQMYSELERIRNSGLNLTVCVDTTAASGGYLMSLPANKIVAAPYALVGSIGVVVEMVNGYHFLKEHGIEPVTITAGKYKRTITPISEVTEEAKEHFQERLEAIHRLFIESVKKYRNVDAEAVCTGEFWTAKESLDRGLNLVDELGTSQDYLFKINQTKDLIVISQKKGRFEQSMIKMATHIVDVLLAKFGLATTI